MEWIFFLSSGFWCSFRLWGEPVNLREQHDAYEFFNTLVDNIDEGLKARGYKTVCANVLGGSFADQKICKGCPHRSVCFSLYHLKWNISGNHVFSPNR